MGYLSLDNFKGEYIFGLGILFDVITTIYGIRLGIIEGNILGFFNLLILNSILLYFSILTIRLDRSKFINIALILIGVFRFLVGIHNFILIYNL